MPNIPLTELIDGAAIPFTMAHAVVSTLLASRTSERHRSRRINAWPMALFRRFRRPLTRKVHGSPEPPMAVASIEFILLNAGLVAIGAVAVMVQSSVASPLAALHRTLWQ
jgi:hypothetical protein